MKPVWKIVSKPSLFADAFKLAQFGRKHGIKMQIRWEDGRYIVERRID